MDPHAPSPPPVPAIERRAFAVLFAVLLVNAAGNTAMISVLPAIGRALALPDVGMAMIYSASACLWVFMAPYWARRAEVRGRKAMIRLGNTGLAISMAVMAMSVLAGQQQLIPAMAALLVFAGGRAVFGLLGSAAGPSAQAWVAARTTPANRTAALALLASAFGLGTVIGPASAPFFVLPFVSLAGPMIAFCLASLAMGYAINRWLPGRSPAEIAAESAVHADRPRLSWRDPRILPYVLFGFGVGTIHAAISQMLGFLLIDLLKVSPAESTHFIGVAMMVAAAATLLAQWGVIRMMRMTPRQLILSSSIIIAGSCLLAATASTYGGIVTAYAVMSFGFGLGRPGFTAGASLAVEAHEQNAVAGIVTATLGASYILAPALGVQLYHWNADAPFLFSALLAAIILAYSWRNRVIAQNDTAGHEDPPSLLD